MEHCSALEARLAAADTECAALRQLGVAKGHEAQGLVDSMCDMTGA